MATVYVGSARSDENGKAHSGKAGDQKSGREVSTQAWYKHSKGWRVFRAKDPAKAAVIARQMQAACDNNRIGYDQWQRNTLYTQAQKVGFDIAKVTVACETDCSALVRVCCAAAGILDLPSGFRTGNMPANLLATSEFVELKGSKYTDQSAYLGAGDILVTKTSGHTVVVLNNGDKYEGTVEVKPYALGERNLRNGDEGEDVRTLQSYLIDLGYDLGRWGADGDFGDATELAVEKFQRDRKLSVDGVYGPKSHAALMDAIDAQTEPVEARYVEISGGQCWVRTAPNTTGGKLGVVKPGERLPYGGQTDGGWLLVEYKGQNGWVSGKYGKLKEE